MRRKFPPHEINRILDAQDGKCALCGHKILSWQKFDRDHIIPLAAGGLDEISNLQIVHHSCHVKKTAGDMKTISKIRRLRKGGNRRKGRAIPGSKDSNWKCRLTGRGHRWERR